MAEQTITANDTLVAAVNELQLMFTGKVLTHVSEAYNTARIIWNGMIDHHPLMIAQCITAADGVAAVKYARKNNLTVSVKGGGHNVAGNSVCDGGLMIDLSKMRSIHVDGVNKIAKAEPGVILRELDAANTAIQSCNNHRHCF